MNKASIDEDLVLDLCEYPMNNLHVWNQDNWEIRICPSYEDLGVFYFKLYNNSCIEKATKQARISLLKPEYIMAPIHYKEEWILDEKEKEKLMKILLGKLYIGDSLPIDNKVDNVYEYIKFSYKEQRYGMHGLKVPDEFMNSTIPDYTKL